MAPTNSEALNEKIFVSNCIAALTLNAQAAVMHVMQTAAAHWNSNTLVCFLTGAAAAGQARDGYSPQGVQQQQW
jgi:hypothetical protein